jgi:hypothetical protein
MIRRSSHRRAVAIPVPLLTDERLSFRARGLAAFLLSKPDAWRIDARALARTATEGRDAILKALGELRDAGYLVTRRGQAEDGRWWTESVLYEDPADAATDSENPQASPQAGDTTEVGKPGPGQPDPGASGHSSSTREVKPPTPSLTAGDPPLSASQDHQGQHHNCRACQTNRRGPKPADPAEVAAEARRVELAAQDEQRRQREAEAAATALPPATLAAGARNARLALRGERPPDELAS